MRIAFCGTPSPAVTVADALVHAGHDIVHVVTRPDRRRGRGAAVVPSPVKAWATDHGVPVAHRLRSLEEVTADLVVVVAYGAIIGDDLLARWPFVNVHFSLLPRWRGAAPIERAILAGDQETGVCIMAIESTLDTGPVYAVSRTTVGEKTAAELAAELAALGGAALIDVLAGGLPLPDPRPQLGEPTYAEKLQPADFQLSASDAVEVVLAKIRCQRAATLVDGQRHKILEATAVPGEGTPGTVAGAQWFCANGAWQPTRIQPEGSRPMSYESWLAGRRGVGPDTWGTMP
jgi:methionyl-tRNA formyltransferase